MASYISHPLIKKDSIESRLYQQVLAGDVLKKGNTMVVAPTALGKTIVAILVAADRLQKVKNSKVLILVIYHWKSKIQICSIFSKGNTLL